jgi:hypothetical protein
MIGTILNAAGILAGGLTALVRRRPLSPTTENNGRIILGVFAVYYGLRLTWLSLNGPFLGILKQLLILLLALTLGQLAGRLLRLQRASNRLGRMVRELMDGARPTDPGRFGKGFRACTAVFCAAPLGLLGAVQDGLSGYFYPLAVKAVVDGLATLGFVPMFGRGVLMSALPVLAVQGTISLACQQFVKPFLEARQLLDSTNAAGGMLVFAVALVILGLRKMALTDYLPSLVFAPLLTCLFR